MISWQDSRAARWCVTHAELEPTVVRSTGLVLSAHYVGPKVATLLESDVEWAGRFREARSRFGTLDSFVMSRWCREDVHETDVTMAARTAMFDLALGKWSEALLRRYAIPRDALPLVRPSTGRGLRLDDGLMLRTSIADQAAAALTLFQEGESCSVAILGTGAFVMRPAAGATERVPGYLCAPVLARPGSEPVFVQEGPVNGAGAAVDRFGTGPTPLPRVDPSPQAFCIPDAAGLGAPFWRPEIGLTLSAAAEGLAPPDLRRIAVEGVLFRVRQALDGLGALDSGRILVAGGLTREASVPSGLAALLDRPVHVLDDHEAVLLATARLAADLSPFVSPPAAVVRPGLEGGYLRDKYPRWEAWLERQLVRTG
jgi:glycerol kinase